MKVPYNWIKDYVDIDVTPQELGDMLTLTGSQLEEVITQGDIIKKVWFLKDLFVTVSTTAVYSRYIYTEQIYHIQGG